MEKSISQQGRQQHTKYYMLNGEQALKRFLRNKNISTILYFFIGMGWVVYGAMKDQSTIMLLVVVVLTLIHRYLMASRWRGLLEILTKDCDPLKLMDIWERMEQKNLRLTRNPDFLRYKALCCLYREERREEGFQYLKQVSYKKKSCAKEMATLNLYASYYFYQNDKNNYLQIVSEFEALPGKYRIHKSLKRLYENVHNNMQLALLLWEEKDSEARKLMEIMLEQNKQHRLNSVMLHMRLAKLDRKAGEQENEANHLQYVIDNGNTLSVVEEAKKLNSCHDDRICGH